MEWEVQTAQSLNLDLRILQNRTMRDAQSDSHSFSQGADFRVYKDWISHLCQEGETYSTLLYLYCRYPNSQAPRHGKFPPPTHHWVRGSACQLSLATQTGSGK